MAIVLTDDKHYKDIANFIRDTDIYGEGDTNSYTPEQMVGGLNNLFIKAINYHAEEGYYRGESHGYQEGRQAEHDAFWESYLEPPYNDTIFGFGMFAGAAWKEDNCNPNLKTHKTITPKYAQYMFAYNTYIQDLDEWCERNNLTIDFSQNRNFSYMFYGMGSHLKSVGIIDTRSAPTTVANCFYGAEGLHTIKHLILKDDGLQSLNGTFTRNTSLENITISGKIGTSLANFSESTLLTHESLMSIIGALYDYSGTSTTRTITLGATNLAKLTDAEKAIAVQKGWSLA